MDEMIILCPGQGAQAVGMGKAWAEASPEARAVFEQADRVLGDSLGRPLSALCFEGPAETLNRTDVSQPAIFTASVASWRGLRAAMGLGDGDAKLAAAGGLSLGEYTALHVAGAIGFEDALRLVALRGRAMQDAAEAGPSGMVAVIGPDDEQAEALAQDAAQGEVLVCANFNCPGQVVLSGAISACDRAAALAADRGFRATVLQVAGAFHSPFMAPAAERLREALAGAEIAEPRCPVMSNVTGMPHAADGGTIAATIRRRLVEQLTSPVRWSACCGWIVGNAAGQFHELAPGKTLMGMMRRIDRSAKVATHDTP